LDRRFQPEFTSARHLTDALSVETLRKLMTIGVFLPAHFASVTAIQNRHVTGGTCAAPMARTKPDLFKRTIPASRRTNLPSIPILRLREPNRQQKCQAQAPAPA
jgi:hypothetical protein